MLKICLSSHIEGITWFFVLEVLEEIRHLHPLPGIILEFRSMGKLLAEVKEIMLILQTSARADGPHAKVQPAWCCSWRDGLRVLVRWHAAGGQQG